MNDYTPTFEGISKEDFIDAFVQGSEIVVIYNEVYDHSDNHSTKFQNDITVRKTDENLAKIKAIFDLDLRQDYTVSTVRKPRKNAVVGLLEQVTYAHYTCEYCGCQGRYEIDGARDRDDIHFIITTECCNNRIELVGNKEML